MKVLKVFGFRIVNKMNAINAFPVLESIRAEMGKASFSLPDNATPSSNDAMTGMIQELLKSILSLDPNFVEKLRVKFFKNIEAKTKETTTGW